MYARGIKALIGLNHSKCKWHGGDVTSWDGKFGNGSHTDWMREGLFEGSVWNSVHPTGSLSHHECHLNSPKTCGERYSSTSKSQNEFVLNHWTRLRIKCQTRCEFWTLSVGCLRNTTGLHLTCALKESLESWPLFYKISIGVTLINLWNWTFYILLLVIGWYILTV